MQKICYLECWSSIVRLPIFLWWLLASMKPQSNWWASLFRANTLFWAWLLPMHRGYGVAAFASEERYPILRQCDVCCWLHWRYNSVGVAMAGPTLRTTSSKSFSMMRTLVVCKHEAKSGGGGSESPPKANKHLCAVPIVFFADIWARQFVKTTFCCKNMMWKCAGSRCKPILGCTGDRGLRMVAFFILSRSFWVECSTSSPWLASRKHLRFTYSCTSALPPAASFGSSTRIASGQ